MAAYAIYFNGNILLQCQNGTYPACRQVLVDALARASTLGHFDEMNTTGQVDNPDYDEAKTRLDAADALWEKYKNTPDAVAGHNALETEQYEKEAAALRSASAALSELRGYPVTVIVSDVPPEPPTDVPPSEPKKRKRKAKEEVVEDPKITE